MIENLTKVIAVDFDGTLVENCYPDIGPPKMHVINKAIKEKRNGTKLILWTCRCNKQLDDAINYCKTFGLTFDAINCNVPERIELYKDDSRKVSADEYWDDRAVQFE